MTPKQIDVKAKRIERSLNHLIEAATLSGYTVRVFVERIDCIKIMNRDPRWVKRLSVEVERS